MTALELQQRINQGEAFNIFDIRQLERFVSFHLPGALHVEKGALLESPAKYMNQQDTYYITCNGGNSATMLATLLQAQGYKIISLVGGMNALIKKD